MPDNIIISSSKWIEQDKQTLFGNEEVTFCDATELSALMKETGVYKSTSEARRAERFGPIPTGYTEFKASKKRHLFIWNPTE